MQPFLGQIMAVGFNFAPRGWAICGGQLLPISSNTALFSLLGTTYGGDGRTTFGLPDLQGRSIVGQGQGPGLNNVRWGEKAGVENITLSVANMPSHNHGVNIVPGTATSDIADGNFLAHQTRGGGNVPEIYSPGTPSSQLASGAVTNNGGGQSFNSRNPYLGMYYNIATVGLYPSRS